MARRDEKDMYKVVIIMAMIVYILHVAVIIVFSMVNPNVTLPFAFAILMVTMIGALFVYNDQLSAVALNVFVGSILVANLLLSIGFCHWYKSIESENNVVVQ